MSYKVTGEGTNIQLVRLDEKGKATSARPASPEELGMYKENIALRAEREESAHRIAQLRARISAALAYPDELSKVPHPERAAWLTSRMAEDAAMMDAKERDDLGTVERG